MTSVEKRHSSRRSGSHRKHSDGGYSDTSSAGSFLDETDREVSNLTDRAFRSLCIGDEAVYNDSDLCPSSPTAQRERQLAFSQSNRDFDKGERDALKRNAQESYGLRVQQYGQDWTQAGQHGVETQGDLQLGSYGEGRMEGRVSATFQRSYVDMSQQERSVREEHLSYHSNGTVEVGGQQRRSRSRVSSLIKAFNSEGYRDGGGLDGQLRDWNSETSWDKTALMSIQRELSEFSTAYHQSLNSGGFLSDGPFSSSGNPLYPSEVSAAMGHMAHMDASASFMRSPHSQHNMSTQLNSNSNFFMHSELSPFKVWRDHNRFPFQQGALSGYVPRSEFPKWYETPMYKELSLGPQPQDPYMYEERGVRSQRKALNPVAPAPPPRSTSTNTVLQKAMALEKRCESELGHYPPWKRSQSVGTNRLPSQRPSTASPTIEMSRHVQDTLTSISDLQQRITMMTTEERMTTEMMAQRDGGLHGYDSLTPFHNKMTTVTVEQNVVSNNAGTTPYNIGQLLAPAEMTEVQGYSDSPPMVEHAPVRAESRGATPDIRKSRYRSRASSLMFNLKDNRKRVKSTYSPTKFKSLETMDKNKRADQDEHPRDTVIDIPDFPDTQIPRVTGHEEPNAVDATSYPHLQGRRSPGMSFTGYGSQPSMAHMGQHTEYASANYLTAQMQGETAYHAQFSSFPEGNYTNRPQVSNGQYVQGDLTPFSPFKLGEIGTMEGMPSDLYRQTNNLGVPNTLAAVSQAHPKPNLSPRPSYFMTENPRLNINRSDQNRETLVPTTEQNPYKSMGMGYTNRHRYEQVSGNKYMYSDTSSQDSWKQQLYVNNTSSRDTEIPTTNDRSLAVKAPWKGEIAALIERDKQAQSSRRAAMMQQDIHSPRQTYEGQNQWNINKENETSRGQTFAEDASFLPQTTAFHPPYQTLANHNPPNQMQPHPQYNSEIGHNDKGQQQTRTLSDTYNLQKLHGLQIKESYLAPNYHVYGETEQDYREQHQFYPEGDNMLSRQEPVQPQTDREEWTKQAREEREISERARTERIKAEKIKAGQAKAIAEKAKAERLEAEKAEAERLKAEKAEADRLKAERIKAEKAEAERLKSEKLKAEKAEAERIKAEKAEAERLKAEKAEAERIKAEKDEAERLRAEKAEAERLKAEKAEAERLKAEKAEAERIKAEKAEADRLKAEKAEAERLKAEKAEADRLTAEKAEAERLKAEKAEAERIKAEKAEAERIKAEKAEAERLKAEKAEAERLKAEKAEVERIKAEKAEAERLKAEKAEAERIKAEKAEAERIKAEKAEAERLKAEKAEAERIKAEKAEAERLKAEKAEAERIKAERLIAEKAEAERIKAERIKAEKAEAERLKAEKAEAERIKAEKIKAEKAEAERIKAEKLKAEKAEAERLKAEKAEAERIKAERLKAEKAEAERLKAEKAEAERKKAERLKAEKAEADRIKAEKIKAEKAEAERIKAEKAEAERLKAEKAEAERLKAEKAEAERIKAEKAEAERLKAEKAEAERLKAEKAEAERIKAEKAKAERLKAEKAEAERIKAAKAEAERLRAEKAEAERIKAEKAEAERLKAEKAEAERIKAERLKAEKAEAERIKAERLKAEKAEAERLKAEKAEAERIKAEKAEAERLKAEKAEAERIKAEKAEAERIKAEKAEAERLKAEKAEAERIKAEKAEAERIKAEKAEAERLKAEKAEAERLKAEKAEAERIKAEKAEAERIKAEKAEAERIKAEKAEAERIKAEKAEAERIKAEKAEAERIKAEKAEAERIKAEKADAERVKAQQVKIERARAEQMKSEQVKAEQLKAGLATIGKIKAESAKSKVKQAETKQVRIEPTKVEHVKTELAKAKAELAKIKEKMRGDQKEKVRSAGSGNEGDNTSQDFSVMSKSTKNDGRNPAFATDPGEESVSRIKLKAESNIIIQTATDTTEDNEKDCSIEHHEVKENQYVYSETLKEFKLFSANDSNKTATSKTFSNKNNNDMQTNEEKYSQLKYKPEDASVLKTSKDNHQFESALPKNSDASHARKPKPSEHSIIPSRDTNSSIRASSHKERAQTKQEILTSKIKAHAEKEISAIKEKGFAQNPIKHLTIGQGNNIRQKPPSQEAYKRQETTVYPHVASKQQMGATGMTTDPDKVSSLPSFNVASVKPLPMTNQPPDRQSQPKVSPETETSKDTVAQPLVEAEWIGNNAKSADEETKQWLKNDKPSTTKELTALSFREQESKHVENFVKQKERSKAATIIDLVNETKEMDPPHVRASIYKPELAVPKADTTKETLPSNKAESKNDDSTPSLKLVLGQAETSAEDDSLQIMGIRVMVRERNPSESSVDVESAVQEVPPSKEKGRDLCVGLSKAMGPAHPARGNAQDTSNVETVKNKTPLTKENGTNAQQEILSSDGESHKTTRLRDPMADKDEPSTALKPAKNKLSTETQPLVFKQGMIRNTEEDRSENLSKTSAKGGTDDATEHNLRQRKLQTQYEVKAAESNTESGKKQEDKHLFINWNKDGQIAPLLVEKRQDGSSQEDTLHNKSVTVKNMPYASPPEDDIHIDGIAIRIVPGANEKERYKINENQPAIKISPNNLSATNDNQAVPVSVPDDKIITTKEETKLSMPAHRRLTQTKDHYEAQPPNGRQAENGMKKKDDNGEPDEVKRDGDMTYDTKEESTDGDYFEIQRTFETSHKQNDYSPDVPCTSDVVSQREESSSQKISADPAHGLGSPGPAVGGEITGLRLDKASIDKESHLSLETRKGSAEFSREKDNKSDMNRTNTSMKDNQVSQNSDGLIDSQGSISSDTQAGKQDSVNQSYLLAKERQQAKKLQSAKDSAVQKANDKPKPKEKVSTIPEISAIADYARLKVIASEDREDIMPTLPPNKKEDYFPRIGTRPSRRPVFTLETPEPEVKEKLPREPEVSAKVNKEPKSLVFSTMEQEHKRTGLFRLGEKDRHENTLPDVRVSERVMDAENLKTQHLRQSSKPTPEHLITPGSREQRIFSPEPQGLKAQNVHQPRAVPVPSSSSASEAHSKTGNAMLSQPPDQHAYPIHVERPAHNTLSSRPERTMTGTLYDMYDLEQRRATQREEERRAKQRVEERAAKIEEEMRQRRREEERLAAQREMERKVKLAEEEEKLRQSEEKATRREEERRAKQAEEERRKQMDEERRAKQREEAKRAKEREERAAKIEEERREKQRREEQIAAQREMERRAEERRAKQMEEERRAKQLEEERRARQLEEERARQLEEEMRARKLEEERRARQLEEERRAKQMEEERAAKAAEEKRRKQIEEENRMKQEEERRAAQIEEERRIKQLEERRAKQMEEQRAAKFAEEARQNQAEEESRVSQQEERAKQMMEEEQRTQQEEEEKRAMQREEQLAAKREEQRRAAQKMDALQYYAISSAEPDRRHRDRPLRSPLPSSRRVEPTERESPEDGRPHRPQAASSPAPPHARSNTSSPAPGAKPTMFRVKDNTFKGSPFTKSVKPRLHKSFGGDSRVASPMEGWRGSERGDEEQDRMRHNAGTPVHHDTVMGSHRLSTVRRSQTPQQTHSSQQSSVYSESRPYSRRSIVLDEEDSRSVMSAMSEDAESFATSAADLAELRGLYDYDRPESACSFSSDVGRALGKPPTVPPKSEKALRRAKRLTTRRIKKESSRSAAASPALEEKPVHAVSDVPSSPTNTQSLDSVASPHFSSPISLAHAPTMVSGVRASTTETQSSHRSLHATPPVSLPVATPHHTAPVAIPNVPKTVPSVPSSPTLHVTHPGPVAQYQVEPSYAQTFPMTQRKVLQDPGSGQYYVVDMPVQVKTKTFFDPETGKYVQLNVRQSAQNRASQPQLQVQPRSHTSAATQPYLLYQGYQGYHQGYQPVPVSSLPPHRSSSGMSAPSTVPQETEPIRRIYGYQENERGQNSHNYSPEQTPYMDTAHDTQKTQDANTTYNTHVSYDTCPDYDSRLEEDSVNENDNLVRSSSQARDIISIGELEDFMDVSDW